MPGFHFRILVLVFVFALSQSAAAQDATWINGSGGNFGTNSNWNTGSKPGFDDEATFSINSTYDVTLNNPEEIVAGLNVTDGDVRLLGGNILTVKTGSGANTNIDSGVLRVEGNGTVLNSELMSLSNSGEINVTKSGVLSVGDNPSTFDNVDGQISVGSFGANGATLSAYSGSKVRTDGFIFSGLSNGASGRIEVSGADSELNAGGDGYFGYRGDSSLVVEDQASVSNANGYLGLFATSNGTANIGFQSRWDNSGSLEIGRFGTGFLQINNGGAVTAEEVFLGSTTIGTGLLNITSDGSLTANRNLYIGTSNSTSGQVLASVNGGKIQVGDSGTGISQGIVVGDSGSDGNLYFRRGLLETSSDMSVAFDSGSQGVVEVTGSESRLEVNGNSRVGVAGIAELRVDDSADVEIGNHLAIGIQINSQGTVTVQNQGRLTVENSLSLGIDEDGRGEGEGSLDISTGGTVIVGSASTTVNAEGLHVLNGGSIDARNGAEIETTESFVDFNGALSLRESQFGNSGSAQIFGTLSVEDFGSASFGGDLTVGRSFGSSALSNVYVDQGQLNVEGNTEFRRGEMFFAVAEANLLGDFDIGDDDSNAVADATFSRSTMNLAGDLAVGVGAGSASLAFFDGDVAGTQAVVSGRTTVGENGYIVVDTSTFDFGTTDLESYSRIGYYPDSTPNGMQGTLVGHVENDGYAHVSDLNGFNKLRYDTSGVTLENLGVIYGDGATDVQFSTTADSEIRTRTGEWSRFGASEIQNHGEVNILGGTTEFENSLTNKLDGEINNFDGTLIADNLVNDVGGFISGRGEFLTNGITNNGAMAFSGGFADVHGDVGNLGVIVTAGDGVTTFYDDVLHNGQEIHTAADSDTVYFGEFSGAGAHTGAGDVFMEGDFRPGNSPDVLTFEGNLHLGTNALTSIELGGTEFGAFDRLEVAGDMTLNGLLEVELLSGLDLGAGDFFEIADVGGMLLGEFTGLAEGDLVGNFGGTDLFISYRWGDGNNVALFTAVPEPGSLAVVTFATGILMLRRRRQNHFAEC